MGRGVLSISRLVGAAAAAAVAWLVAAAAITWTALPALRTDFYSSIARDQVETFQGRVGVKTTTGGDWIHAGWIADPERENYRVSLRSGGEAWRLVETTRYGSALLRDLRADSDYEVKVEAVAEGPAERSDGAGAAGPRSATAPRAAASAAATRELGTARVRTTAGPGPLERPVVAEPWRTLFRPSKAGNYVNDHAVFRDGSGRWRLLGITGPGRGDYNSELRLAHGRAPDRAIDRGAPVAGPLRFGELLAAGGMVEDEPVADFRQAAWAPHVVRDGGGLFHLFWSPHRLAHAVSVDGANWYRRADAIARPSGWFFRDAMVFEVARSQWLLYATARGWWYSRVDLYQSFDLDHWQRIGAAWQARRGSERNALVSSAESPFVVERAGRYYLSITYNNETGITAPIALALGPWTGGARAYNDTLVFASTNPYDFGRWRGRGRASQLVAQLEAHAPEFVHDDADDAWYATTGGWPLAATLTGGEVAAARLRWETAAQ